VSRRRIAYVLKRFPRVSETFVAAELIELERQGERVTVFALSRPVEPVSHDFLRELSAPVVYLPRRPTREPLRVARALLRVIWRDPGGWLRAARLSLRPPRFVGWRRLLQATVLREDFAGAGIDHAHAHFASTAARLAHLVRIMGGPTYSVTAHAKDLYHRDVRIDRLREKLGGADFVATVSKENKRYLESVLDGRARCLVVPNSVDLRRLDQARQRQVERGLIVSVARLVEKKGLSHLIDACVLLSRPEVRLDLAGDGPQRAELEARADRARLPVIFYGALPQERVISLVRRAAVFCLPCVVARDGDRDGLPTSVLEAMALGVPVVTTAVNGLAETVEHERTGLVVPERDTTALAAAIGRLLDEPELASSLASEARRRVERCHSLERNASRLRSLFPEAA
jgi:colanic acid/amylovoran biosynthesis glycosyltransferase